VLWSVEFSPDGRWLATSTWNGKGVRVWEAKTGRRVTDLLGTVNSEAAFSPDGGWLVTGTERGYRFWEVGSWRPGRRIPQENSSPRQRMAFSRDGGLLAVWSSRGTVRLLRPETG
jgi:WD40 repeat protein